MMKWKIVLLLLIVVKLSYATVYPVYWRCANNQLIAVNPQVTIENKRMDLYVNYNALQSKAPDSSPLQAEHTVNIPAILARGNFIMLGAKDDWQMNCVGQLVSNQSGKQVIFDVNGNAATCPLIPKGCA